MQRKRFILIRRRWRFAVRLRKIIFNGNMRRESNSLTNLLRTRDLGSSMSRCVNLTQHVALFRSQSHVNESKLKFARERNELLIDKFSAGSEAHFFWMSGTVTRDSLTPKYNADLKINYSGEKGFMWGGEESFSLETNLFGARLKRKLLEWIIEER